MSGFASARECAARIMSRLAKELAATVDQFYKTEILVLSGNPKPPITNEFIQGELVTIPVDTSALAKDLVFSVPDVGGAAIGRWRDFVMGSPRDPGGRCSFRRSFPRLDQLQRHGGAISGRCVPSPAAFFDVTDLYQTDIYGPAASRCRGQVSGVAVPYSTGRCAMTGRKKTFSASSFTMRTIR